MGSLGSDEVEYELDILPFRKYKNGRIERYAGEDFAPPLDHHPSTGVSSKDVLIQPSTGVSARLYLPNPPIPHGLIKNNEKQKEKKLPLLVYFHGGGFVVGSPFTPMYDSYVNTLVSKSGVVAVSVRYRRAPECPLPAAYDDSWAALQWVASHASSHGPDSWLNEYADFGRVFLAGDSAGANIAHNLAMRAGEEVVGRGITLEGVVLVHPYFWGKERLPKEGGANQPLAKKIDGMWALVCPSSEMGNDDPRVNPTAARAPSMEGLGCNRVLVCVAEKDMFCGRGLQYYEGLRRSGWGGKVDVWETKGEGHVFHLLDPVSANAIEMMQRLVALFNGV